MKLKYLVWSVGLCGALILSGGCAQSRKLMGFERPVSDPSQVMIEKDLVIPPDIDKRALPEPSEIQQTKAEPVVEKKEPTVKKKSQKAPEKLDVREILLG